MTRGGAWDKELGPEPEGGVRGASPYLVRLSAPCILEAVPRD